MLTTSSTSHQTNLFGTNHLQQLDVADPLLELLAAIPWHEFDEAFSIHFTKTAGAPSKPIRLMAAAVWNMKQWLIAIFWLFFHGERCRLLERPDGNPHHQALYYYGDSLFPTACLK